MRGVAQAKSVSQYGGEIILAGGSQGTVTVSGKLNASNKRYGRHGGNVTITGNNILIDDGAVIDVSGDAGGGNINIGGSAGGVGPLPNANAVVLMPGASLLANAITSGNGGNIALWSNNSTEAYGILSAQGGILGGNGGYIETSGHYLDINGIQVNTNAPMGVTGQWLLDPFDVTISGNADNDPPTGFAGNTYNPTIETSNINYATLNANLANTDVLYHH